MKARFFFYVLLLSFLCLFSPRSGSAALVTVIPANAAWKYLANGSNQGTAWTSPAFNDAAWPSAPAQLGYGDGDESTVIPSGAATVYFRRNVTIPAGITSARLRLLRDDGAVVYVNGVEVRRDNMPAGPVTYDTLALAAVGTTDETTFFESSVPTNAFVTGNNVIAVEVHQVNLSSSDLSFALELVVDAPAPGPVITVVALDDQAREIPPWLDIPEDPAVFRLSRTGSTNNSLSVSIRMSGTAANGVDYDVVGDVVTFAAGSSTSDVIIHAIDDSLAEGTETVVLNLVPTPCPECYTIGTPGSATAFILDNEPTNSPPTVNIFSPANGTTYKAPANIQLRASAHDPEDSYDISVEFYEGTNRIGAAQFLPTLCPSPECPSWELTWSNVPPGNYIVRAIAKDTAAMLGVSSPVSITVLPNNPPVATTLISTGSVWKYNDIGSDLGTLWREPIYDDSAWPAGPAQLGYGDGDEATVVGSGSDPTTKNITTYFRHTFLVSDASAISDLNLRVLRDDGVVVYLNGREVYRNNMPAGPVAFNTLAASVAVDENAFLEAPIARDALVSGVNVVAAEIHQVNVTSSDIGFDLALTGERNEGTPNEPPVITIVHPTNNTVVTEGSQLFIMSSLHDADGAAAHATVEIFANAASLGLAQLTDPGPLHDAAFRLISSITTPGQYALRAKATDDRGAVAYSEPVLVRVGEVPPTNEPPRITITSPSDGTVYSAGSNPSFVFQVTVDPPDADFEGQLAVVEVFANDQFLGYANSASGSSIFGFQWFSIPAGQFDIHARATDFRGLPGVSEPIHITVIEVPDCPPAIQWQKSPGGPGYDEFYQTLQLPDGGYVSAGVSYSSGNEFDFWIVRFDSAGVVQWERLYGGPSGDQLFDMALASDGGFILAGTSRSPAGPRKAAPLIGDYDFWVVRLDANGNRLWDRSYGGAGAEFARSVVQTDDGGFVISGESNSEPGPGKSAPHFGDYDMWVVRIDAAGNRLWDRSYGGTAQEFWTKLSKTHDGGFVLTATTQSGADGNKSTPGYGSIDGLVVRIDSAGNKLWDQTSGGTENDYLGTALELPDGGFITAGWSGSGISGNKTTPPHGGGDAWFLGLNADGSRRWERSFGGTASDSVHLLARTSDGNFVAAGFSSSGAELDKTSPTTGIWLIGITGNGDKLWDTSIGNNLIESIHQTSDGGFILGGVYFDPGPQGWILKLDKITDCHADSDHDGVPDLRDECPDTAAGDIVDEHGCSIAQLAPCHGPWRNHADYVRAVVRQAWQFFRQGLITAEQRREIEKAAVRSDCGKHERERVSLHLLPLTPSECQRQGVAFLLSGDHSGGCVVESSTDLQNWTPLIAPVVGITGDEFACPASDDSRARFYRVRLTQP